MSRRPDRGFTARALSSAILQYDGTTGAFINAFTGTGISRPSGMSFGGDGLLYVADSGSNKILRFASLTAGTVPDVLASIGYPLGVARAPDGDLYVGLNAGVIVELTPASPSWTAQMFVSNGGGNLKTPSSVFVDDVGNVFVGNTGVPGPNVIEYDSAGQVLQQFGTADGGSMYNTVVVWPVPEPASAALLGITMVVLFRRRRQS